MKFAKSSTGRLRQILFVHFVTIGSSLPLSTATAADFTINIGVSLPIRGTSCNGPGMVTLHDGRLADTPTNAATHHLPNGAHTTIPPGAVHATITLDYNRISHDRQHALNLFSIDIEKYTQARALLAASSLLYDLNQNTAVDQGGNWCSITIAVTLPQASGFYVLPGTQTTSRAGFTSIPSTSLTCSPAPNPACSFTIPKPPNGGTTNTPAQDKAQFENYTQADEILALSERLSSQ